MIFLDISFQNQFGFTHIYKLNQWEKHFDWLNFLPGGLDTSIAKNGWMMQWYQSNVRFANGAFISVLWLENRSAASAALLDEKKQTFELI